MRYALGVAIIVACVSAPALATEAITYGYDAQGRLVTALHTGSVNNGSQTVISYDPADNRTNYTVATVTNALSVTDASATEGGNLSFTITRPGAAAANVTVNYTTADGTATAGSDYTATSGTLTFAPSDTSRTVTVATLADAAVEGDEVLTLSLSSPSGGATLARGIGTGTIIDANSSQTTFSIANAPSVTEGAALVYTVTKSGVTSLTTSVNYATANGSGTAGTDYAAVFGTLSFASSETSKTISVPTTDDSTIEPPRTVLVNLSAPTSGATIAAVQGSGTINDNDSAPITVTNPALHYSASSSSAIAITTLANLNGRSGRVTSFVPSTGGGSATISTDGSTVTYHAPSVSTPAACEPAEMDHYTAAYVVQDAGNSSNVSGTAALAITGAAGGRPKPPSTCN
jgi:hypothetical protein